MDSVAKILESYPWLADAMKVLLGIIVGSGGIWSLLRHRLAKREHALQAAMVISQLRKELGDRLVQLIEKSGQYENIRDGKVKVPIPGNELKRLQAQIDLLKDDILAGELRLAKLEGREPRSINLSYIRPSPPTGLRIV